jgi:hypothetical protein
MKHFFRDYVTAVGSYVGLIAVGLVITLTVSSAVGYLPYSDRPGPGWIGPSFSFGQLGYYLSWSTLLLLPSAIYTTGIFVFARLLSLFDAPLVVIRIIGALSAAFIGLVLASGVGWYISMAAFPAYVAAGLGVAWGGVLLPRYLGPKPPPRRTWVRWTANSIVLLAGSSGLYCTFFAPRYTQNLHVIILRVTPSEERLVTGPWARELEPHESALLDSVLRNGHLQRGLTGWSSSGDGGNRARMLIVVTAPLTSDARLREPKGVSVVYIQRGEKWAMFPPNAQTLKRLVTLGPGSKPDELTFAWPGSRADPFAWAPD